MPRGRSFLLPTPEAAFTRVTDICITDHPHIPLCTLVTTIAAVRQIHAVTVPAVVPAATVDMARHIVAMDVCPIVML